MDGRTGGVPGRGEPVGGRGCVEVRAARGDDEEEEDGEEGGDAYACVAASEGERAAEEAGVDSDSDSVSL